MARYPITSEFLMEEPFRQKAHLGIDYAMTKGTPLRTIQEGVIERVVNQPSGIGKAVYVKWVDGKTAIYGHMDSISVRTGDKVYIGDLLGFSGNTGNVVGVNGGYHLHFAVKNEFGSFINPSPYTPYIQEMNHDLIGLIQSKSDGLISLTDSYTNILQQAMDYFGSSLQDIGSNLDVSSLIDLLNNSPFP